MATRKKKPATRKSASAAGASPAGWILLSGALFVAGIAGGYVWRSYAPLPVAPGTPLSGEVTPLPDLYGAESEEAAELREAEAELEEVRQRLRELEQVQTEAEKDLAEIQIQNLLE